MRVLQTIVVEYVDHDEARHTFTVPLGQVLRALASNDCSCTILVKGMSCFWWPSKDLLAAGMCGHHSVEGVWLNYHTEVGQHQE